MSWRDLPLLFSLSRSRGTPSFGCWALSLSFFFPRPRRIQICNGRRCDEKEEIWDGFVRNGGNRSQRPFQKIFALTRLLRLSIQSDLCVKELSRATTCSRHMVHVEVSLTLPNTTNPVARYNRRPPRWCHDPANFFRWTTQYSCTPRCGLQQKNERSRKKRRRKKWGLTSTYYNCAPCSAAYTRLKAFLTLASAPVIVTVLTGSPSCLSDTLTRLPDCFMIF